MMTKLTHTSRNSERHFGMDAQCSEMATPRRRPGWRVWDVSAGDAAELLAAGRVMELCRADAALSMRVFRLRHDPNTLTPTWRAVLAIIERKPK